MSALRSRTVSDFLTRPGVGASSVLLAAPSAFSVLSCLPQRPRVVPAKASHTIGPNGRRAFHLSSVFGGVVDTTAQALVTIQQAGLPWWMTIPLLAVGVNFTIRLPVAFYARSIANRRALASPYTLLWGHRHNASNSGSVEDPFKRFSNTFFKVRRSKKRLHKTFGAQTWKLAASVLLPMVPFVLATETLRQMCGAPTSVVAGYITQASSASKTAALFDPSLAQGGVAWFTDLTAMDPYFILPVLCSGILFRRTLMRMDSGDMKAVFSLANRTDKSSFNLRRELKLGQVRSILILTLFPLLFLDLPSGIFLYWATSFGLHGLNEMIVDKVIPRPPRLKVPSRRHTAYSYLRGPA